MSDNLIRTSVEQNDEQIIKKQVMNKTDDNIIRHQVLGIEETTPVIESKTITENGEYTAPEGVDGYSPITVSVGGLPDIPLPQEYQEVEYIDFDGNSYVTISVINKSPFSAFRSPPSSASSRFPNLDMLMISTSSSPWV